MEKYLPESLSGCLCILSTIAQTNEHLRTIQLIICIITGIITLVLTAWRLIKTYKEAKKDGVIDPEERKKLEEMKKALYEEAGKLAQEYGKLKEDLEEKKDDDRN